MASLDKASWVNTLTTMQHRAGEYAGARADGARVRTAELQGRINTWANPQIVYSPWDWSSRTYNYYNIFSGPDTRTAAERQQEKDDDRAATALKIGIIGLIAGAATMGWSICKWNSERLSLNETEKAQTAFTSADGSIEQIFDRQVAKLARLLNAVEALDRHRMIKANKLLCLATVFTAGAAMMTIGGFTTSMIWITAGQITMVAATAIGAGVLMYHWFADGELTLQAREITRQSGALIEYLRERDGKREEDPRSPPPYSSLYPNLPEAEGPPPTYGYWTDRPPPSYYNSSFFLPGHRQAVFATRPPAYE